MSRYITTIWEVSIFVTCFSLYIEYIKEQTSLTSILSIIYLEYLSPMDSYFITNIRSKRVFLKKNDQFWNFKLLWQTIYNLLGNWLQHQDHHMEGHHSTPLLKSPPKSTGCQKFQTLLIIHVLINLIIFLYSERSLNSAENAEQAIFLQNVKNVE